MSEFILKGVRGISSTSASDDLAINLRQFFDWALLQEKNFTNVTIPTSGIWGGNKEVLRQTSFPGQASGTVWEGFRSNWVWETGVPSVSTQPIRVSGVYINGNHFLPLSSGVKVDYQRGRVTLPFAVNSAKCEYSHRQINVFDANIPWFQQIQNGSLRTDNEQFSLLGSGVYHILAENRIQLPAIVIEPTPVIRYTPKQLGGYQYRTQEVYFHVFAESPSTRNTLTDILCAQTEKTIRMFDWDTVRANQRFPLNFDGTPNPSGYMYPQNISSFGVRKITFDAFSGEYIEPTPPVFMGLVRGTVTVDCYM